MKNIAVLGIAVMAVASGIVYCVLAADNGSKSPSGQPAAVAPQATGSAWAGPTAAKDSDAASAPAAGQGPGMAAVRKAAAGGKYLFIFFHQGDDTSTAAMRKAFDGAVAKAGEKAESVVVKVDDPADKDIVAKYGVTRAPMPLALAVAPNGAITGGFPTQFDEKTLLDAFASSGMEKCLKALQERKLVLLCVQNSSTKSNEAATKGVQDFKSDVRFAQFTEIVGVDPADAAESKFLAQLRIEPKTTEAVTALLLPPGAVVGTFKGAVDKDTLVSALMAATSGGCGSGGCGPGGCN